MCSGPIFLPSFLNSKLSKYLKLPEVTPTAPTLSRVFRSLMRSKSTSRSSVFFKRRGVVIALRLRAARRPQRRRRNARREEAGHAEGRDQRGAGFVEQRARAVARGDRIPRHRRRHHLPEFLEAIDALVGLVAGDDRGIDGADRDARDPFRFEPGAAQRLKGAGLIGAERAAALQHQHALRFGGRGGRRGSWNDPS